MSNKIKKFCKQPGCNELTDRTYCEKHRIERVKHYDNSRGTAHQRGYTYRWQQYSKQFLKRPENLFCKLQLKGCTNISECVDHIEPPAGPKDSLFWDPNNHQAACIHCNSMKGHKKLKGEGKPFEAIRKG